MSPPRHPTDRTPSRENGPDAMPAQDRSSALFTLPGTAATVVLQIMTIRSRIRRRPGCCRGGGGAAASSSHVRRKGTMTDAPAYRPAVGGPRRHRPGGPLFGEAISSTTKRCTAPHAPVRDGPSVPSSSTAIGAEDGLPHSRRRQRAHIIAAVSVPGSITHGGKACSPTTPRRSRSHRGYRRASAWPTAAAVALVVALAALSAPGIGASAAETDPAVPPPMPPREPHRPDDIAIGRGPGPSSRRAGNLRRKDGNNNNNNNNSSPRQGENANADADARHLSRVFADGRPSSNGFDFDVSFLDAPAVKNRDNEKDYTYGDPVLVTEMGRPHDNEENQEEEETTISDMYGNSNPTLAALLDADNRHHHQPSSTTTTTTTSTAPLTDALTTTSSSTVQARIVGGTLTPRPPNLRYPYMVSLQRRGYPICGAFLIAPDCILTAAHCRGSFDSAEVGRWDLAADATAESAPAPFGIAECTVHPSFTYFVDGRIGNDFMVCQLDRQVDVDRYPPVHLNADPAVPPPSEAVTVVGWGRTSSGGARSDEQRQATLRVVSNPQCRQAQGCLAPGQCYGYQGIIQSNMLCAHFGGDGTDASAPRDSCQGDSGGPLLVPGTEDDGSGDTVVGIVSFGVGCAEELFPGIYARISAAHAWIVAEAARLSEYGGIRGVGSSSEPPSSSPTSGPTGQPTGTPSASPSAVPSPTPTAQRSAQPSSLPTITPSSPPSLTGSAPPSSSSPPTHRNVPSSSPTTSASPTQSTQEPSSMPSTSAAPSNNPTIEEEEADEEEEEEDDDEPKTNEYDNERWRRRRYRPGTVSITRDDGQPLAVTEDGTESAAVEWFTCPQEHILQANEAECDPAQVSTCTYDQYCWNSCTQKSYVAGVFASTCRPSVRKFERIPTRMCPLFACKKPEQSSSSGDEVSGRIAEDPITEEKPAATTKTRASLKFLMDRNRQRQHRPAYDDASR